MTDHAPYHFERHGRSPATGIAVLLTWVLCILAVLVFDAALWIVGVILVFTLPALWDLWSAKSAGVHLGNGELTWYSGRAEATVTFDEIEHLRFVTRLDLTVRIAVVLKSGKKLRLPPESTPPHRIFETHLTQMGVRTERHHFTFL